MDFDTQKGSSPLGAQVALLSVALLCVSVVSGWGVREQDTHP